MGNKVNLVRPMSPTQIDIILEGLEGRSAQEITR
jgi:hypothetical protein